MLEMPKTHKVKKTFCSYFEFEREYDGERVVKETMIASKAWIKDLKKKTKNTIKPIAKSSLVLIDEDEEVF
jgi:hypothetical protein